MLAIALASDRFNPFGAREELPYDAIDAVARVEEGQLVFDSLQLHAETLRMGATGKGGAVEPYALEGVVGLFFFPGLDSLIDRVPILNRVILGEKRKLRRRILHDHGTMGRAGREPDPDPVHRDGAGWLPHRGPARLRARRDQAHPVRDPAERRRGGRKDRWAGGFVRQRAPRSKLLSRAAAARAVRAAQRRGERVVLTAAASTCCTWGTCAAWQRRVAWATGWWSA